MNLDVDQHCFVCGPENDQGLHLRFECGEGKAATELTLSPHHQGYAGVVHGGIIAAVLDEVMVYAAVSLGRWAATAELTLRYSRPAPLGVPLTARGEVVRQQRRLVECRAELVAPNGTVLTTATAKLIQGRPVEEHEDVKREEA